MDALSEKHFEHAKSMAKSLNVAARPLRILTSVAWDNKLRQGFLRKGIIPKPEYVPIDVSGSLSDIKNVQARIKGDHVVFNWLRRLANDLEVTANMISARGTPEFFEHSSKLYGQPSALMVDGSTKVIDLALHMDQTLDGLDMKKLVVEGYETHYTARQFARKLRPLLKKHFGRHMPKVEISSTVSANAAATSKRIRVRQDAHFTHRDIEQLLQHEALIHTATALNGQSQTHLPILGRAHAGTTEIQEGLAVFAEIISGAMDPVRFRRLSDRVIAIQNVIDGADFKDVYEFYRERSEDSRIGREQSYENTRRIFRGGVISGLSLIHI